MGKENDSQDSFVSGKGPMKVTADPPKKKTSHGDARTIFNSRVGVR